MDKIFLVSGGYKYVDLNGRLHQVGVCCYKYMYYHYRSHWLFHGKLHRLNGSSYLGPGNIPFRIYGKTINLNIGKLVI